jgi:hypothetical protein
VNNKRGNREELGRSPIVVTSVLYIVDALRCSWLLIKAGVATVVLRLMNKRSGR